MVNLGAFPPLKQMVGIFFLFFEKSKPNDSRFFLDKKAGKKSRLTLERLKIVSLG